MAATGDLARRQCNFTISRSGKATVTDATAGETLCAMKAGDVGLVGDIEREHKKLNDKLKNFKVYPVVALGVIYRF